MPFTIWIKPIPIIRKRVDMLHAVWIDRLEGSTLVPVCNEYDYGTLYCYFPDNPQENCSYKIT